METPESVQSGRQGRGVLDCPVDGCQASIIGLYGDLLTHVQTEHPYQRLLADEDGETVIDRIKNAQKDALKADIQEQMVVENTSE